MWVRILLGAPLPSGDTMIYILIAHFFVGITWFCLVVNYANKNYEDISPLAIVVALFWEWFLAFAAYDWLKSKIKLP